MILRSARRVGAAVLLAVALTAPVGAQVAQIAPVDEALRDPSLFAFRAQLQSAVTRRDVDALLSMVDPAIKAGFGGEDGIEAFKSIWKISGKRADPQLWRELGSALAFGGAMSGVSSFQAPYVYARWPDDLDAFGHVAIVGTGVRVRANPNLASKTIGILSFAIVPLAREGELLSDEIAEQWVAVRLADGAVGYVASDYVKSPVGYRAIFDKIDGRWRMTMFLAGD